MKACQSPGPADDSMMISDSPPDSNPGRSLASSDSSELEIIACALASGILIPAALRKVVNTVYTETSKVVKAVILSMVNTAEILFLRMVSLRHTLKYFNAISVMAFVLTKSLAEQAEPDTDTSTLNKSSEIQVS